LILISNQLKHDFIQHLLLFVSISLTNQTRNYTVTTEQCKFSIGQHPINQLFVHAVKIISSITSY